METLTNAINILNIHNTNEECMICRDELQCSQCYTLPECNHTYHTNCIVSWFRNGDSRCPYCGNKGINNKNTSNMGEYLSRTSNNRYYSMHYEAQSLVDIRKNIYLKKYDTNKRCLQIRKQFEKIKILEETYKSECEKMRVYKQSLNETPSLYSEAKKNILAHRSKKWKLTKQIRLEKFKIVNNSYIIPLIIPLSVTI